MDFKEKLEKALGKEWLEFLPKVEVVLEPILSKLTEEKAYVKIYPEPKNVFRAFSYMKPSEVKMVWVGQDPYHWPPGQATGLSFECGKLTSPSWRKIGEVYRNYGGTDMNIMSGKLDRWARQGVLLLNMALTVREKIPGSHLTLWDPFTRYLVSCLLTDMTNPKGFVILGDKAKQRIPRIASPHKGFYYEHPAAASYQQRPWFAKDIFKEMNDFLKFHGHEIKW